jgi:hypothetical protein
MIFINHRLLCAVFLPNSSQNYCALLIEVHKIFLMTLDPKPRQPWLRTESATVPPISYKNRVYINILVQLLLAILENFNYFISERRMSQIALAT